MCDRPIHDPIAKAALPARQVGRKEEASRAHLPGDCVIPSRQQTCEQTAWWELVVLPRCRPRGCSQERVLPPRLVPAQGGCKDPEVQLDAEARPTGQLLPHCFLNLGVESKLLD